ncbi:type II secretion system F family protein [uncultured Aeromicrobium sp.]|uniref:type II secretion system F family protein n=1 Tax=uncultured Aeromicrobium sp. TaxID=337820 RepID=UPI0025DAE38C|nr:type II secretion system F family protein [uncultured Aeromicrobium sp.]
MTVSVLLLIATLALFLLAITQFLTASNELSRLRRAIDPRDEEGTGRASTARLDRLIQSSPVGPTLEAARLQIGAPLTISQLTALIIAASISLGVILGSMLSWLLFPLGVLLGVYAFRWYVRRKADQRREAFIAQMPDLARTLSNAASAGLSVRTAIALAAEDMDEPARSELTEVSNELGLGRSLEHAVGDMERRLPSREVSVLVNSLIVASRSGGALVSALRDIADTLETRKELRREIRTTYAQTLATAYAVLGMGVLSLFLIESIADGSVDAMLRSNIGRLTLIFAGGVYGFALWLVRRMTRVEV